MIPKIEFISPAVGPTAGGDLVRVVGRGFAASIRVEFDGVTSDLMAVTEELGLSVALVRTPAHSEGLATVTVSNLDTTGDDVPGEMAEQEDAYRFRRPKLVAESRVTLIARRLLQALKAQVLQNTSMAVSLDYIADPGDRAVLVPKATLPSLVLSGPELQENTFYRSNVAATEVVDGPHGPELVIRRPGLCVDVSFVLTGASDRTVELLNLMHAVTTFLNHNKWLRVGNSRLELDYDHRVRSNLRGPDDVKVFTLGLVLKGVEVGDTLPADIARQLDGDTSLQVGRQP